MELFYSTLSPVSPFLLTASCCVSLFTAVDAAFFLRLSPCHKPISSTSPKQLATSTSQTMLLAPLYLVGAREPLSCQDQNLLSSRVKPIDIERARVRNGVFFRSTKPAPETNSPRRLASRRAKSGVLQDVTLDRAQRVQNISRR